MADIGSGRTRGRKGRRIALTVTTILAGGFALPALAQDAPLRPNYDANGVDLTTGGFMVPIVEGKIGSGVGELAMMRYRYNDKTLDNWTGELRKVVSGGTTTITVNFGGVSDKFTLVSGSYVAAKANGATLVENTTDEEFTYTAADGTVIAYKSPILLAYPGPFDRPPAPLTLSMPSGYCNSSNAQACGVPVSITRANQSTATLSYDTPAYCTYDMELNPTECFIYQRLTSVSNAAGYAMAISYKSNSLSGGVPVTNWFIRNTLSFSDTTCSSGCSTPTVTYTSGSQFTDWQGGTWQINASGSTTGIRRPGSSSDDIVYTITSGKVSSVAKDGVTTNYSWSTGSGTITSTATDPASNATVVVTDTNKSAPTSITTGGDTTGITYDSNGRMTRITMPEGNYTDYTLDSRGNVTATTRVAKSGSGLSNITTSASFPSTCTYIVSCNKPDYTIDERGNRTDYTYSTTHGGVTRIQFPAPTGSTRPETNITYTAVNGVYLVSQVTRCATAATCSGTANETKTTYTYGSGGGIDNLQPLTKTVAAGDGSVTATETYTYNDNGELASVDGPLSGSDDTVYYRYGTVGGATGKLIGIIGPDPDGGGSLKRRALRYGYTDAGQIDAVQIGTVDGLTDTNWTNFAVLQSTFTEYDTDNRKIKEWLEANSTKYSLTQFSYNSRGLLECATVRMNPSEYASLAAACTLDTEGSYGKDRITNYTYDANGNPTVIKTGYGSGVEANEVTTTYTDNGQVATVTDGEGNKTSYTYDGHDRQSKTSYPNSTKGAGTSSSTDYEELIYDAASNVTSVRLRGYAGDSSKHIDFTYDNWNRVTAKTLPNSEPEVTYTYDFLNRMTGASQTGNALTFAFDALGRNTSQGGPQGTVSYQYDAAGRRTRLTWPDSVYVTYEYDVAGDMTAIKNATPATIVGFSYDDRGRRTSLTRTGSTVSYGYDDISRRTSLGLDLTSSGDVTSSFTYAPSGQIASKTQNNDNYAYTGATNGLRSYTSNGLNQLTAAAGASPAPSYDARGNLTGIGSDSYTYSSENRLTGATVSGVSTTQVYDPAGRLYETATPTKTFRFQYDGNDLIAEYNGSGTLLRRYVHGPRVDEPLIWYEGTGTGTPTFLHADERGSIVALTDGSGTPLSSGPINRYDEYGINVIGGRFGYTGQAYIASLGMYYYKARMYSPTLGRFMQPDPIGYGSGFNRYAYVRNDPTNFNDPTGLAGGPPDPPNPDPVDPDDTILVTGDKCTVLVAIKCILMVLPDYLSGWSLDWFDKERCKGLKYIPDGARLRVGADAAGGWGGAIRLGAGVSVDNKGAYFADMHAKPGVGVANEAVVGASLQFNAPTTSSFSLETNLGAGYGPGASVSLPAASFDKDGFHGPTTPSGSASLPMYPMQGHFGGQATVTAGPEVVVPLTGQTCP